MKIQIKVFAALKEYFSNEFEIEVQSNAKLADVFNELEIQNPKAKSILQICFAAVDEEYIEKDFPLKENLQLNLFPPASGG
jgi:molybdopterin converting factor small subunit